jgi:hypothetical protein
MASEVDVTRAINAIAATLNDQKLERFDAERIQEVVTGATGGEQKLIAYGSGTSGQLREHSMDGPPVAQLSYEDGKWSVTRIPETRDSPGLREADQQQTKEKEIEYQHPVRGRLTIWKKKVTGS